MTYDEYASKLNQHHLIKKAKEMDYKTFKLYCNSEIDKVQKMKIPSKIEGKEELLSMKKRYVECLRLVNYIVATGDAKMSGKMEDRNIAKAIVEHYESEGYLAPGTAAKFEG